MKNLSFLLIALLGLSSPLYSGECCYGNYWGGCDWYCENIAVELGVGYRQDNLKWAFNGFSPGESIHESWKDINIGFVEANVRQKFCEDYVLLVDADYGISGWQKKHHVKLIDYNSDATTFRPTTKTKASVYDISIRLGRQICFCCEEITITPQIGWSYNHQKFTNPSFYANKHFESKYSWNTALIGLDIGYQMCCEWSVNVNYAFHTGNFHAKIDEFFRVRGHSVQCFGNEVGAGLFYQPCDDWIYGLKFNYKNFLGHHKSSVTDTFDNDSHRRRPIWNSISVSADIGFNF